MHCVPGPCLVCLARSGWLVQAPNPAEPSSRGARFADDAASVACARPAPRLPRLRMLSASASLRVSPLAVCLGVRLVSPASPPTLPGIRGLSDPTPPFSQKVLEPK